MKQSKYKIKENDELKAKCRKLYKTGLSTREIKKIVGKSHTWIWQVVRELSTE